MRQTRRSPGLGSRASSEVIAATEESVADRPDTSRTLTAGDTLAAVDALRGRQQTFNREQVAYLMHLAYLSGQTDTHVNDVARTVCTWEDNAVMRRTYEQRVADELADMDRAARDRAAREGRPYRIYRGGPVDWETGEPVRRQPAIRRAA